MTDSTTESGMIYVPSRMVGLYFIVICDARNDGNRVYLFHT